MDKPISTHAGRWFAWSLAAPVGAFLVTIGIMSIPMNRQGIDILAGRDLFRAHCGSCHFAKAGFPAHLGPNLHEIGRTGATRKPNQTAVEYILESLLDPSAFVAPSSRPGMPPNVAAEIDPDDIRNIIGFLASRGAFPDYDEIKNLEIPDRRMEQTEPGLIRLQDMQLAETVLREKGACLECHSLYSVPESKIFAPGLFNVGLKNKDTIRKSMLEPHSEIKDNYESVTIVLENGQITSGQLMYKDEQLLVLCTRDEQNRLVMRNIPLADIEEEDGQPLILEATTSIMPVGFDEVLTEEEIEATISLIRQLN